MTISEMHTAVDLGLQKVSSYQYDNFLPQEIDFFLNKMQDRFIKDVFSKWGDNKRLGFEAIQKRLDDIRMLITKAESSFGQSSYEDFASLPDDYCYAVNLRANIYKENCGKSQATTSSTESLESVRIVEQDMLYKMLKNPFASPNGNTPIAVFEGNSIRIISNKLSILKSYALEYIRKPVKMDLSLCIDCELPEHTHQEVVDLTIKHILEAIESQRYQTNSVEHNEKE
jgi:hypothetical protein